MTKRTKAQLETENAELRAQNKLLHDVVTRLITSPPMPSIVPYPIPAPVPHPTVNPLPWLPEWPVTTATPLWQLNPHAACAAPMMPPPGTVTWIGKIGYHDLPGATSTH